MSWQSFGFENGRAEVLESGTWTNWFRFSADRTFTCERVRNGFRLVDLRRKQARILY